MLFPCDNIPDAITCDSSLWDQLDTLDVGPPSLVTLADLGHIFEGPPHSRSSLLVSNDCAVEIALVY